MGTLSGMFLSTNPVHLPHLLSVWHGSFIGWPHTPNTNARCSDCPGWIWSGVLNA